ncbi:MAG: hypothetical protein DRP80_06805 [Candidatus Omnitrophota bacterium]|nr:MAG: hypothetical protein DRP80_06805 [Candidatus Omnitrophota bacterium]
MGVRVPRPPPIFNFCIFEDFYLIFAEFISHQACFVARPGLAKATIIGIFEIKEKGLLKQI